jgi:hypothetical protein
MQANKFVVLQKKLNMMLSTNFVESIRTTFRFVGQFLVELISEIKYEDERNT